jgi:TetR/AcrR family transcriptional regulator, mexCD-oprJ operon repressor
MQMTEAAVDHRRATAERNAASILDAAERLLARGASLNMRAIAAEAGVSRPTLYAHYASIGDVVEGVVAHAVGESVSAIEAAEPERGPAGEALERVAAASWGRIAHFDEVARGAIEHIPAASLHRTHAPIMGHVRALVVRGQQEGDIRGDLPADWLVTMYFALVHGAADHVRAHRLGRDRALALLLTSLRDLSAARPGEAS